MVSFSIEPYLQPYSMFSGQGPIGVNISSIVSVSDPRPNLIEAYKQSSTKMDDDNMPAPNLNSKHTEYVEAPDKDDYDADDEKEIDEALTRAFNGVKKKKETILH